MTLTEKLPSSSDRVFDELPWYRSWVVEQVRSQPRRIFLCLPEIDFDGDPDWTGFFLLWDQIRELILRPGPKSISSITDTLISSGTISIQDNDEGPQSAKDLVFSVLGRQTVCHVEIQWVDYLPCHLELDRPSGRLFVYRYPSFCVASLQQHRGVDGNEGRNSVVYRCAFDRPDLVPWATEEGVTGLPEEVLLSYRLIFGQGKRSRSGISPAATYICHASGSRSAPRRALRSEEISVSCAVDWAG